MIYQILELHKSLKKGECVKIIALGDYSTYLSKSDILKPTQEAQVLKIVGVNGRHVALNCNHVIVACVISERWL
ncbi:MAG: hypothetical protein IKF79_01665 [Methanosphaera sp.]|nr:hypothetical protein [Methanosphaera sp.]